MVHRLLEETQKSCDKLDLHRCSQIPKKKSGKTKRLGNLDSLLMEAVALSSHAAAHFLKQEFMKASPLESIYYLSKRVPSLLTGLLGGLKHLKIETRLIYAKFATPWCQNCLVSVFYHCTLFHSSCTDPLFLLFLFPLLPFHHFFPSSFSDRNKLLDLSVCCSTCQSSNLFLSENNYS